MEVQPEVIIALIVGAALLVFFAVGMLLSRAGKAPWKTELKNSIDAALHARTQSKAEAVAALVTMDALFDQLLKHISSGDTMGERLKQARTKFPREDYNLIWEAHKLRNIVVHEPGNKIRKDDLKQARKILADIATSYLSS